MKTIKVSEATNTQLNWLVARCEGDSITLMRNDDGSLFPMPVWKDGLWQLNYATSWNQMGPIIERERISVCPLHHDWECTLDMDEGDAMVQTATGPTSLIAAARCYVASKMGEIVEVPEELS